MPHELCQTQSAFACSVAEPRMSVGLSPELDEVDESGATGGRVATCMRHITMNVQLEPDWK
jgi:hypothetical protein